MKHFILCLLAALITLPSLAQNKFSSFMEDMQGERDVMRKNNILSCAVYALNSPNTEVQTEPVEGEAATDLAKKDQLHQLLKYDNVGNLIKMELFNAEDIAIGKFSANYGEETSTASFLGFDANGKLTTNKLEEYDGSSRLVRTQTELYLGSDTKRNKEEFSYNEIGLCTGKLHMEDGIRQTSTYMYDSQGRELEEIITDHDGNVLAKNQSKYDENGNLIEWTSVSGNDKKDFGYKYSYNEKGKRVQLAEVTGKGEETSRFEYIYNDSGSLIEIVRYNGKRQMERKVFTVDENGLTRARIEYDQSNKPVSKYIYKYDREFQTPAGPDFGTSGQE